MDYMEEAKEIAEQCWNDKKNKDKIIDKDLVDAIAGRIANCMETAARQADSVKYYKGLVEQIGEAFGQPAYTQDDGGIVTDVLCAKVPGLVKDLLNSKKGRGVNRTAMYNELTEMFIDYQLRVDNPVQPSTKEEKLTEKTKFFTDPTFNGKVQALVSAVMHILDNHI